MSMGEFDEQLNKGRDEYSSHPAPGCLIPPDFSEEDLVFAQELNAFFSPDEEELPPYFVQTLLEPEDPRFVPVEHGLVQKTSARVFRRLNLRRRLFSSQRASLGAALSEVGALPSQRSLMALSITFLLIMFLTVAFTGQSFSMGVALLLHGDRAGVYPVAQYPNGFASSSADNDISMQQPQALSLMHTRQLMHFPMYSPIAVPADYELTAIYLYREPNQSWVDGPILELEYDYFGTDASHMGTGQIFVREFKPKGDVLQLVQNGATQPIEIDQNGKPKAIYVDGQWVSRGRGELPQWVYGTRSELIYQQGDVVFWIVGDQRDKIGQKQLWDIAASLRVVDVPWAAHLGAFMNYTTRIVESLPGPFTSDVLLVFPDDSNDTPYLTTFERKMGGMMTG